MTHESGARDMSGEGHADSGDEDLTVVRPRSVGGEASEETVVVPGLGGSSAEETVVVPRRGAASPEETVVVSRRGRSSPEETVVTPRRGVASAAEPAEEDDERTVVAPGVAGLSPELQAQMFKKPMDPRRAVVESPFPHSEGAMPKRGVRAGMPVLYTPRSGAEQSQNTAQQAQIEARIGPPPPAHPVPAAERQDLPSTARANRRFRRATLIGFAAAIVASVVGLWAIASVAFGGA